MRVVCRVFAAGQFARWPTVWLLACVAGCGATSPYYPVTGRITLDGQPLPEADVAFLPAGEQGEPSFGFTDAQGVYELRHTQSLAGAPEGSYSIRISTYREPKEGTESTQPLSTERVPTRYNTSSELTAHVKPAENVLDFDLLSRP